MVVAPNYYLGEGRLANGKSEKNKAMGALAVTFCENASSDNLFVQSAIGNNVYNCPNGEEIFSEESYDKRKYFEHNQYYECAEFIFDLIQGYNDSIEVLEPEESTAAKKHQP